MLAIRRAGVNRADAKWSGLLVQVRNPEVLPCTCHAMPAPVDAATLSCRQPGQAAHELLIGLGSSPQLSCLKRVEAQPILQQVTVQTTTAPAPRLHSQSTQNVLCFMCAYVCLPLSLSSYVCPVLEFFPLKCPFPLFFSGDKSSQQANSC